MCIRDSVYSVRRYLDRDITIRSNVGTRLEKAFAHSMVQANYLKQFSAKLQDVSALYANTENGLVGAADIAQKEQAKKRTADSSQTAVDYFSDPRSRGVFFKYIDYIDYIANLGPEDLVLLGLSEMEDVLMDLLFGKNNAVENMKAALANILSGMNRCV